MSDTYNDQTLERCRELIMSGELSSTPYEGILQNDLDAGDLESAYEHLKLAQTFLEQE